MDQYEKAYNDIKIKLENAKAEEKAFNGPCIQCKHCVSNGDMMSDFREYYCKHPLVITPKFSSTQGEIIAEKHHIGKIKRKGYNQSIPYICGHNRILFERDLVMPTIQLLAALLFLAFSVWIFY